MRQELSTPGAAHDRFRTWVRDEKTVMYSVDITAATAPGITKVLVGQALEVVTSRKNGLDPAHIALLSAVDGHKRRLAGSEATAKAVVDAKKVSEETRQESIHDHTKRGEAFDKTKTALVAQQSFEAANPDHPLSQFEADLQEAMRVTGRERILQIGGHQLPFGPWRYV